MEDLPSAFSTANALFDFKLSKDVGLSKGKGKRLEKKDGDYKKDGEKEKANGQSLGSTFSKGN